MKYYLIMIAGLLSLSGCVTNGVTPEQYFATQQQISTLQQRIADLQAEQSTLKRQIEEMSKAARLPSGVAAIPSARRNDNSGGTPINAHSSNNMGSAGYQEALALYKAGDITGAITQFEQLIGSGVLSSSEVTSTQYWLGDAYFNQRNYDMASRYLGAYLKASPTGQHSQSALNKLVHALQAIGRSEDAEVLSQQGVNALM